MLAMVALVVAGVAGLVLLGGDDVAAPAGIDTGATAAESGSDTETARSEPTVTRLDAPQRTGQARCAVPSAKILAQQPLAFDGTVTEITDERVTLEPTMFYAGEPTDLVRVTAPPAELRGLLLSVEFQVGQRYLVAADNGRVSICGYSGLWSEGLERLYLKAFS